MNHPKGFNGYRDRGKPRRYRTDKTCQAKRRYTSEVEARAGAVVDMRERANRHRLWVYRCPHCSGWHLTHKEQGRRWEVIGENPVAADAPAT